MESSTFKEVEFFTVKLSQDLYEVLFYYHTYKSRIDIMVENLNLPKG